MHYANPLSKRLSEDFDSGSRDSIDGQTPPKPNAGIVRLPSLDEGGNGKVKPLDLYVVSASPSFEDSSGQRSPGEALSESTGMSVRPECLREDGSPGSPAQSFKAALEAKIQVGESERERRRRVAYEYIEENWMVGARAFAVGPAD